MFNALKYTEELERAGFTRSQAETSVRLLIDIMNETFATKSDILMLKGDIESLRNELRTEVKTLASCIRELDYKLTIKLGSMMVVGLGVIATLLRLMPR
jgi:hypothetical protein